MTSATEELRRLLDERGVEWRRTPHYSSESQDNETVFEGNGIEWYANDHLNGRLGLRALRYEVTPEQAVAATLGPRTCYNASMVMDEYGQARFLCSECGAWIDSRILWNPEYRDGESPWVSGCKLNYCPNCGAKVVE